MTKKIIVEFYLVDAFEIYHFLPIYQEMIRRKEFDVKFVAEPPRLNYAGRHFNHDESLKILKRLNVMFSERSNRESDVAITTQSVEHIAHYKNKKFRLGYGVGLVKDYFLYTKSAITGFDGLLLNGMYKVDIIFTMIDINRVIPIGCPKYDDFFNKGTKRKHYLLKQKTRKNILYLPTWDRDSSVSLFESEIKELTHNYNVYIKMHHCTARNASTNPHDRKTLLSIEAKIINEHISTSDVISDVDLVIVDAKSGVLTECLYLDYKVPIIALSPRINIKKDFWKEIFEIAPVLSVPGLLKDAVQEILHKDVYLASRYKYSSVFYSKNNGNSSKKTINALLQLITLPTVSKTRNKQYMRIKRKFFFVIRDLPFILVQKIFK